MRFFDIAVFLLVFNLLGSVFVQVGFFGGTLDPATGQAKDMEQRINGAYEDTSTVNEQSGVQGDLSFLVENVRNVLAGVSIFVDVFAGAVLVKPTLTNLVCDTATCEPGGFMMDFINAIQTFVVLLYVVGGVQFISGRSFPNIQ